ncbi:MAG: hypothetical protein IIB17_06140, partial [Chloroflexi bacterium]|nr:hypothetical protein [Chloroflexota bacterium]
MLRMSDTRRRASPFLIRWRLSLWKGAHWRSDSFAWEEPMKLRISATFAVAIFAALMLANAAAQPTVVATIPSVGSGDSVGIAANPITNRIYVTDPGSRTVSVIDGATNSVLENVYLGPWIDDPQD